MFVSYVYKRHNRREWRKLTHERNLSITHIFSSLSDSILKDFIAQHFSKLNTVLIDLFQDIEYEIVILMINKPFLYSHRLMKTKINITA